MKAQASPAVLPPVERAVALVTCFGLAALVVLAVLDRQGVVDLKLVPAIVLAVLDLIGVTTVFLMRRRRLRAGRPARELALTDPTMTRRKRREALAATRRRR